MFRRFKGLFALLAILCVTAIAGGSAYFYFGDQEKEKEEEIIDNSSDSGNESGGITADNILENYEFGTTKDLNEEYTYYFFPSTLYMELYDAQVNPENVFGYNEVILDDNGNPDLDESGQPQYNIVNSQAVGAKDQNNTYYTYYDYLVNSLNNKGDYYLYYEEDAGAQKPYPDTSRLHDDSELGVVDGHKMYYTFKDINDPYALNNPYINDYFNGLKNFPNANDNPNASLELLFGSIKVYYYFYDYSGTTSVDSGDVDLLGRLNNPSQIYNKLTQDSGFNKSTEVLSPIYNNSNYDITLNPQYSAFNAFAGMTGINLDKFNIEKNLLNKAQYRNDRFGFWTSFYDWSDPANQDSYKNLTNQGAKVADRYLPIKITVNGNLTPEDMSKVIPSVSASMFDKEYWFDYTANIWTYVGKDSSNNVDFLTKTYTSAVDGFTAKDITNIFDIMQHPSKYADSNNVIRLFPVFSNGKNYNSSLTDGGRDSLRADFKYKSNTSTITNSINPTSTKLTYSSVTYTSASGNDLSLPGYNYDVNYAVLKNVDLQKDKYDSITIKMSPAYGIHNWGEKDWDDLYSISGSVINNFVAKFGEGLYTFYLFIGNSASHNGPQSNTTPFPTIGEDSLISYITNDLNYSSNELKFKHLNGIVDSSNNYNISATSSFYFFSSSEAGYGTIGAYDRPIGLAVEKVTNLRLVTDIPIDVGGNQDWGSIDSNVEQGLINAQNFTIADDVYKITAEDYLKEDFNNPTGTPIDSTNPYIYIIQNADFRFVNNLYFQIRFSNKYIDGGMNVTTDYKYVSDKAKTPKYLAYKIQNQLIKFKFQDTDNNDVFIENAKVTGSGGVTRDGFKLKDYNASGIYDILLVTTSDEGGKRAMNMYVNRHTNSFIKLFNGYPGTFKNEINLGETSVDDIFVRHKLPSEDANQARLGTSKLLWNGQTYLGEYLTSNSKGDEYVKNDDSTEERPSGESISFLEAIKNELGVTPGNDIIYPIKDAVTGQAIAYYNSGVGRLYTNEGSVFDDKTSLNLFTIMKNYVLYIVNPEGFYGTWTGKVGQNTVTLVLNDDMTGSYNGKSFTYKVEGNKILGTTDDGTEITITYIPETQEIKVHVQDPNGGQASSGTLSEYRPAEGDSSKTTPESSSL